MRGATAAAYGVSWPSISAIAEALTLWPAGSAAGGIPGGVLGGLPSVFLRIFEIAPSVKAFKSFLVLVLS